MSTALRRLAVLIAVVVTSAGCDDRQDRRWLSTGTGPTPVSPLSPVSPGMRGTVVDTAFRRLPGVRIEVVAGPQAGAVTTSDASGRFGFAGPFDESSAFRASKDGYAEATAPLGYCEGCYPQHVAHFTLPLLAPSVDIAGTYDMTITADPRCTLLPEHVRSRTYRVTIPSTASLPAASTGYATVVASGAQFAHGWDSFTVGVAGNDAAFWYESLVERVSDDAFVTVTLSAEATVGGVAPREIVAVGDGWIAFCTRQPGTAGEHCPQNGDATRKVWPCASARHSVVFTRR